MTRTRCAWGLLLVAACAHPGGAPPRPLVSEGVAVSAPTPPAPARATPTPPTSRPRKLSVAAARQYMVELINRDRASEGLAPVLLDDGAATRAGQRHAQDMAKNGYLGHWGTDGSVPEQRFTEAGGTDLDVENASCFTDEKTRTLDRDPEIDSRNVDLAEDMFFHETPPHDGHRRNILKPWHKRVGIGLAQPLATATEIPVPCFAQEFVDAYGTYAPLPGAMRVGDVLHVDGSVQPPATFAGVGLARVDAPSPLPTRELNRRRTYPIPAPYQMYWPPGFETPIPVRVAGSRFQIDVPVGHRGKTGMYELSVWATLPGASEPVMVSLRTTQVVSR